MGWLVALGGCCMAQALVTLEVCGMEAGSSGLRLFRV